MLDAFEIWLLVEVVGILALPAAAFLFARLPGHGLALARPLGLLLLAYPLWLLASLHLVPYRRETAVASLCVLAAVAVGAWSRTGRKRPRGLALRLWLGGEVVFTLGFFGWVLLRSFSPDVWNTEKPMDMAFINAINRSDWFPPHDPWLAGSQLNYYYFGHYLVAFLIRLIGIDPAVGFNLAVALFFALCASSVFAVASTLACAGFKDRVRAGRKALMTGLAAVGLTMLLGNLAGAVQLFRHLQPLGRYDWWAPSRVIDGTANEFPFFSFMLGDLHAHVMATPFALVVVAYSLQLALQGPRLPRRGGRAGACGELLLAALALGSLYAINTLDFPTAVVLLGGGVFLWLNRPSAQLELAAAAYVAALVAVGILLFTPFVAGYSPAAKGIALVRHHEPFTRFVSDLWLIYLFPLWTVVAALATRLAVPIRYFWWGGVALLVVLVLLAPDRLAGPVLLLAVVAACLHAVLDTRLDQAVRFFWLLLTIGLGLLALGDVVYLRDTFENTPSYRFNTVFKTGYQAWFLLTIAATCGAFWYSGWLRRRVVGVWRAGVVAAVALLAIYPVAASYAHSGGFSQPPTLDGLRWLGTREPGDVAAISWLRGNVHGDAAILEAVGNDFSPEGYGRISTFTGLPAVLGWGGHELQWGHDPRARSSDVEALYETHDLDRARTLLARYRIRYVVVGALERGRYPAIDGTKFGRLGAVVFSRSGTTIYRIGSS